MFLVQMLKNSRLRNTPSASHRIFGTTYRMCVAINDYRNIQNRIDTKGENVYKNYDKKCIYEYLYKTICRRK